MQFVRTAAGSQSRVHLGSEGLAGATTPRDFRRAHQTRLGTLSPKREKEIYVAPLPKQVRRQLKLSQGKHRSCLFTASNHPAASLHTQKKMPVLYWGSKTLESPLDCKEIQPVHSEGDQPWVFFGRKDAKAETPVLWPPHEKS